MKNRPLWSVLLFVWVLLTPAAAPAQQSAIEPAASNVVPNLINYSAVLKDASGRPLTGITGVTFLLYNVEQGGTPLWLETQNITPDKTGRYTVQLGTTSARGLPSDLFVTGEARWLAVQIATEAEQGRVLLVAVPYAMKAVDAETLGGLPASAFVLAAPPSDVAAAGSSAASPSSVSAPSPAPLTTSNVTTTGGTAGTIPMFTTATNVQNSILTQAGATAINVLGRLNLPATGTAASTAGFNSRPLDFVASVFNSTTATPVAQTFQWQAEALNNDKSTAAGTLNLLYAAGTAAPAETGLKISSKGLFTFAAGQTFPGTSKITGITAGTDLTGGGSSGNVTLNVDTTKVVTGVAAGTDLTGGGTGGVQTLNLDTTKVPRLAANNTFTGNQTVNGNLSATGVVSGSSYQIGSTLFAFGSFANQNAFLGFAGNPTTTGKNNTASGGHALFSNTAGGNNTADGGAALDNNTTGGGNTASGFGALLSTTTGSNNTGLGWFAGCGGVCAIDSAGSNNTFIGAFASGPAESSGLNNATAIGANAQVTASNSMVLGSINGVNEGTASTNVGIGTTAPTTTLHVVSSSTYQPVLIQTSSGFGTWLELANTSTGGKTWNILSAASGNGEGAGNLAFTNFDASSTVYIHANLKVDGTVSKGGGSFQIDHPLDPANKYLYHSFVESPDMMNIYNGVATLDAHGAVWITLPTYFEALNRDFRYQLTSIGKPQPSLYIAREVSGNRFKISGGRPGGRVSWQVTGIRHDAYADAHRIQAEEDKPPRERGHYLHPELFGAPEEKGVGSVRNPEWMGQVKDATRSSRPVFRVAQQEPSPVASAASQR
jgi:trimeric autotransporter adhesin